MIENPYAPSSTALSAGGDFREIHPDWLWMTVMVHLFAVFALTAVFFSLGDIGWRLTCHGWVSLPLFGPDATLLRIVLPILLAVLPTFFVSAIFKGFYRNRVTSQKLTGRNFFFLLTGIIFAIINASLYDPIT